MMNNFSCDQLHLDILTSSTQSSLNNHIADEVVHVKEADHTNINKIPNIENSISVLNTKISDIQSNIDNSNYVTNEELVAKDYITKQTAKDLYVQKGQLDEYAPKEYVDQKISSIDIEGTSPNIQINASTDSTAVHVDVIKQSTGSNTQQDFKFKFTGFDNLSGGGSGESYTIVTIYRTSDSNTTAPSINKASSSIPTYWSTAITGTGKYLWRSQGRQSKDGNYLQYADFTYWSTPECCGIINGGTSETGADTDTIDYIYWATNDETNIIAPRFTVEQAKTAFESSDYITDNGGGRQRLWYNHPTGVTENKVYEYCSYALYDSKNQIWGNYSTPFIFSHYGVDGKDGDGIEYIYCLNTTNKAPEISYSGFTDKEIQQDDFIPAGGWSDDPLSVDEVNQYQFVAVRKKDGSTGKWGDFSTPALWSVYVKPKDPDSPADVVSQITYYKYGKKDVTMLDTAERYEKDVPDGWTIHPTGDPTDEDYLYMITSKTVNGDTVADEDGYYWSEPARITGVPGPAGTSSTGADGSDINYIYARTKLTTTPTTPTFTVDDLEDYPGQYDQDDSTYGVLTWYDHPQGITEEYRYEWMSIAKKPAGTEDEPSPKWGSYNTPILWSSYGKDGKDGDGIEYIYTRRAEENVPETPTAKYKDNRDDDVPDGWTDDPSGVTEDYPYEYVSVRKQKDGIWQVYSTPTLWARYSKDGAQGKPGVNGKDGVSIMINTRRWDKCNVNDKFYKGESGDPQVDVVYYNGKYYRCIKSFTLEEKATQGPTNTEYWSLFESYSNIATELFLADEASIENLLLNQAKAKNASTGEVTVSIDGDTGKLTAKHAVFDDVVINTSKISYSLALPYAPQFDYQNRNNSNIFGDHSNRTWRVENLPGVGQCAMQLLNCKQSVYIIEQVSVESDIDKFVESTSGAIAYVLPDPSIAGDVCIDLYFKYDKEYQTDDISDSRVLGTYLAVTTPTFNSNVESEHGCYTVPSYTNNFVESTTFFNVTSYIQKPRKSTNSWIKLDTAYTDRNQSNEVDCNLPRHMKLMSNGEIWYIVEIDELP